MASFHEAIREFSALTRRRQGAPLETFDEERFQSLLAFFEHAEGDDLPPARPAPVVAEPAPEPIAAEPAVLPEPVAEPIVLAPEPVAEPIALAPEPVAEPIALAPEPVAEPIVLAPERVAEPIALAPEPVAEPIALAAEPIAAVADEHDIDVSVVEDEPPASHPPVALTIPLAAAPEFGDGIDVDVMEGTPGPAYVPPLGFSASPAPQPPSTFEALGVTEPALPRIVFASVASPSHDHAEVTPPLAASEIVTSAPPAAEPAIVAAPADDAAETVEIMDDSAPVDVSPAIDIDVMELTPGPQREQHQNAWLEAPTSSAPPADPVGTIELAAEELAAEAPPHLDFSAVVNTPFAPPPVLPEPVLAATPVDPAPEPEPLPEFVPLLATEPVAAPEPAPEPPVVAETVEAAPIALAPEPLPPAIEIEVAASLPIVEAVAIAEPAPAEQEPEEELAELVPEPEVADASMFLTALPEEPALEEPGTLPGLPTLNDALAEQRPTVRIQPHELAAMLAASAGHAPATLPIPSSAITPAAPSPAPVLAGTDAEATYIRAPAATPAASEIDEDELLAFARGEVPAAPLPEAQRASHWSDSSAWASEAPAEPPWQPAAAAWSEPAAPAPADDWSQPAPPAPAAWAAPAAPSVAAGWAAATPSWNAPAPAPTAAWNAPAPAAWSEPLPPATTPSWTAPAPAAGWQPRATPPAANDWMEPAAPGGWSAEPPAWNAPAPADEWAAEPATNEPPSWLEPVAVEQTGRTDLHAAPYPAAVDEPEMIVAPASEFLAEAAAQSGWSGEAGGWQAPAAEPDWQAAAQAAASGWDSQAATEPALAPVAGWGAIAAPMQPLPIVLPGEYRVVLHTLEGGVKRGIATDIDLASDAVGLSQGPGLPAAEIIPFSRAKALFFMLQPGERPAVADGRRVKVTFVDGRQVEGVLGEEMGPGFFLLPTEARTSTARVFVLSHAVRSVV
jgi:hypothetical protein